MNNGTAMRKIAKQNGTSTDPVTLPKVSGGTWMRWQNPLYYEHQHNAPDDHFDRREATR